MTTSLTITNSPVVPLAGQANNDQHLIRLWLHGRCIRTQQVYLPEVERFIRFVGVPLHHVTLGMIQAFADSLERLRPATRHRILATIKSLFAFGQRLGYLPFDVTRPLRLPAIRETLNERIMDESETLRIIHLERNPRNAAILSLLYAAGIRVSELCGLRWMDFQPRGDAGQITVFGKGSKTRTILLPSSVWTRVLSIREDSAEDAPAFRSRKGGAMSREQICRIVKAASKTAGISKSVSPHWFRHAHATHALERGAPISLVQATLSHASVATTGRYLHARPSDSSSRYLAV